MPNNHLPPDLNKNRYIKQFLSTVYGISSKEYQKRVWIDAIGPEADSFDETCINFEDCDYILKYEKDFQLSEVQKKSLLELKSEFDKFSSVNFWPPYFIDTPEWTHITELAQKVVQAFNYQYKYPELP